MDMIKNIVFDIGGVLVDFAPDKSMRKLGMPEHLIKPLMDATIFSGLWPELDRGFIPEDVIVNCMKEDHPELAPMIQKFFDEGKSDLVTSFPYSAGWLSDLKDRGYGVYLLTNYPKSFFDIHWGSKFTFTPYVDGKIVSAEVKKNKPDPAIYQCLLDTYGLKAGECVFIDDRKDNVLAAQYMGMGGIRMTNYEDTKNALEELLRR